MSEKEIQPLPAAASENIGKVVCGKPVGKDGKFGICDKPLNHRVGCSNEASRGKNRGAQRKSRGKQSNAIDSNREIKKSEAEEILRSSRAIRNPRVVEVCIELARVAARNLKLPFNRALFTLGVQGVLAKMNDTEPPAFPADEWKQESYSPLREHELWAIWDFATSWRTQRDGSKLTYDQWKELRRISITDLFRFGKEILSLDLHDEPHGRWCRELFVQKKYLLPEEYTWEDVKVALAAQSDIHQRMLISSRSSYKSSVNIVDLLQWVLAFNGDLRIFIISSTSPLSAGFLRKFRAYFTVKNANEPTLLNQLFPEHMLAADDSGSSKNFVSPMRRLDLIQPTLSSTSLDSQGLAGERCDIFVAEDIAEISNSNSPDMREKTLEKFDMLRELLEPFGYLQVVCTPFASGSGSDNDPGDVYAVLLNREEQRIKNGEEPRLRYLVCPAWSVNDWVYGKTAWDPSLKENEVTLLFPSRLSFQHLMSKLKENLITDKNAKIFRQQSLCLWCPDVEEGLRVQFDHEELHRRVKGAGFFSAAPAQVVLALDRATSVSKTADFSALILAKIMPVEGKMAMVVWDCKMERLRQSELVKATVDMLEKYHQLGQTVSVMVAEQDRGWDELAENIKRECLMRGVPLPYFRWRKIDNSPQSKAKRVKTLELPLATGRLWFLGNTIWLDQLLDQFERFDATKRSSAGRKDDGPDATSLGWIECGVRYQEDVPESSEEAKQREEQLEAEAAQARRQQMYHAMFNSPYAPPPPKPEENPEPPKPFDPRDRVFHYGRSVQPGSAREKIFGAKGPWKN